MLGARACIAAEHVTDAHRCVQKRGIKVEDKLGRQQGNGLPSADVAIGCDAAQARAIHWTNAEMCLQRRRSQGSHACNLAGRELVPEVQGLQKQQQ